MGEVGGLGGLVECAGCVRFVCIPEGDVGGGVARPNRTVTNRYQFVKIGPDLNRKVQFFRVYGGLWWWVRVWGSSW